MKKVVNLIIFDLDGVLVEAKNLHFQALNEALSEINPGYKIDWSEHLNKYDGLKTYQKLNLLSGFTVYLVKTPNPN